MEGHTSRPCEARPRDYVFGQTKVAERAQSNLQRIAIRHDPVIPPWQSVVKRAGTVGELRDNASL